MSHLKESVRKWTAGDGKTGKQAGEEGKGVEKNSTNGFMPPTSPQNQNS